MPIINRRVDLFYKISGGALFIYVLLRAIYLPPYADELTSFFRYIQIGSFQPFYAHPDANNHVLNSLFSHLSFLALGDSMFALRLPNVLSFLLYLFFLNKLCRKLNADILGMSLFLTLSTSLFLISFFSICRGYGMSLAFLLGAIYYLQKYSLSRNRTHFTGTLFFSALAFWANLSMMIPIMVLIGLLGFQLHRNFFSDRDLKEYLINISIATVLFVLPFLYAIEYSFFLKNKGLLYLGVEDGLISNVLLPLIWEMTGTRMNGVIVLSLVAICFAISLTLVLIKKIRNGNLIIYSILFSGTLLLSFLLHHLFGINYPTGRAALGMGILLFMLFYQMIDTANNKNLNRLASLPALAILVHLCFSLNLNYAPHLKNESVPKSIHTYLVNWQEENSRKPTISARGLIGSPLQHYDYYAGGVLNQAQENNFPIMSADFLIRCDWNQFETFPGFDTAMHIANTGVTLLRNTRGIVWGKPAHFISEAVSKNSGFIPVWESSTEKYIGSAMSIEIMFEAQSDHFPFKYWLNLDMLNIEGKSIGLHSMNLGSVFGDLREGRIILRRFALGNIPEAAERLKIYLWNIENKQIDISEVEIKIFSASAPAHYD